MSDQVGNQNVGFLMTRLLSSNIIKYPPYLVFCLGGSRFSMYQYWKVIPITKVYFHMSRVVRKPAFCICGNKDADQLRGYREADQRLCFRYTDSTIPLLPKSATSSLCHLLWLYNPVCVRPGQKPRRSVFSQRGSYYYCFL